MAEIAEAAYDIGLEDIVEDKWEWLPGTPNRDIINTGQFGEGFRTFTTGRAWNTKVRAEWTGRSDIIAKVIKYGRADINYPARDYTKRVRAFFRGEIKRKF